MMFYRLLSIVGRQRASPGWQNWSSARNSASAAEARSMALPTQAQVVVCGGGITGTSVAHHQSKMGWKDIVLLEQGRLAAGSTRFCAGILSTARHLTIEQKMADYSNKLYHQLEQETGIQTGYTRTGSIFLAQTQDRLISLKRINAGLNVIGIPSEIISPKKVAELHHLLNVHDLVGAMHVPEDAVVSSADVALALASAASQNAIVDADGRIYIRNWQGGILSGGFEKNPKPIFTEGKNQLEIQNLQEDWDHFEPLLSSLLRRMPELETLEIMKLVNCPETFTPDMRCIMGESPAVQGYFVLAGMNSAGLSFGGGAGKYLAEWMVHGYPSENVWELDLKRFGALQSSRTFLRHRVMEVMPLMYDLKVPRWDFQTGRQLRTSPLYDRLDAQGARWMEKHGFERPKYFVPPDKDLLALEQSKTFYKPDWFDIVESEVKCCKEAVCVIDMSSFTKFEITSTGDQALEVLQYLFSNDLDVPVGHIVHTGMLNEGGGYENDCSIARLNKRSFFMISPTDQQVHCWAWLKKHMPKDSNLLLEDVTWKYTALNLIGPRAVDVLSELSYAPMTPDHFPSLFCKEMSVGYAKGIRVMSMTHTGEPGFMLYIPIEYALHVYNEVMSVGQKYGIRNAGYYALRSLRIEKFFAFWGQDINNLTTPLECGRESRVKLEKGMDFIGRDALLQQKQNGVYKRLTMFILDDHDSDLDLWPWWGEPIYRNGQYVGKTTSSAYSYSLERHVCLGFVHNFSEDTGEEQVVTADFINRGEYEIDIAGYRFQAKAKLYPVASLFTQKRRKDDMELSDLHGK
ncbi:pyruvate dehydrogenase phosphatase regulatory subunit, mitochondrial-like isoform X3 [Homo sapiens]|uniref:pyruvate dehydrogenase phosphatase regulatory subunit, mitochondrial-like isoform X3 n=1 Tax=Homo sapiens TaxID=9606 RepID=UPI0023DF3A9B|nr:pyruvate dehydrogenase phosphatase regulatory subunit, mitochondrial-like isoform X3 [Homo sapiens]XP_054170546.1 pyruvate dehydrogenase phosphatase regulatory subunit, mitochondrial-like isoform X3 [Homo sapiens]